MTHVINLKAINPDLGHNRMWPKKFSYNLYKWLKSASASLDQMAVYSGALAFGANSTNPYRNLFMGTHRFYEGQSDGYRGSFVPEIYNGVSKSYQRSGLLQYQHHDKVVVDVSEWFWSQYTKHGVCGVSGYAESRHDWVHATGGSKRCKNCELWSFRAGTRHIYETDNRQGLRERRVSQVKIWDHQYSKAHVVNAWPWYRDAEGNKVRVVVQPFVHVEQGE